MPKSNKSKRTKINGIVAVNGSEVYVLRETFDHGDGFKGCTGAIIVPVYQEQIEERNDIENLKSDYDYLWREAVKSESTELGLEEYLQELVDSETLYGGKYFFGQDDSYIYEFEFELRELFPDTVTFECIGGGRVFSRNQEFDKVINKELIKIIDENEKPEAPRLSLVTPEGK